MVSSASTLLEAAVIEDFSNFKDSFESYLQNNFLRCWFKDAHGGGGGGVIVQ